MNRCPNDEPTGKNLVCKKALLIPDKKLEKPVRGVASTPSLGHWRVKVGFDCLHFKSRIIFGGTRSVLRFTDFSTHSASKRS